MLTRTPRSPGGPSRADLIVVDDIGMLPAGQDAAEAFYRIVDGAYEHRSLAVTRNYPSMSAEVPHSWFGPWRAKFRTHQVLSDQVRAWTLPPRPPGHATDVVAGLEHLDRVVLDRDAAAERRRAVQPT